MQLSNGNRPKSSQRLILWDYHLISHRTQLSAAEESLLYDYRMAVDYILEINHTKCKKKDF